VITSSTRSRIGYGKAGQGLEWIPKLKAVLASVLAQCPRLLRGVWCEGTSQHSACQKYPALIIRLEVSIYIRSYPYSFVVCNNFSAILICRFTSRTSSLSCRTDTYPVNMVALDGAQSVRSSNSSLSLGEDDRRYLEALKDRDHVATKNTKHPLGLFSVVAFILQQVIGKR
jgi:hypothetical protein